MNNLGRQRITTVASKMAKTDLLLQHAELAKHIPATRRFNRERLRAMLKQYGMVYVKPDAGCQGNGVMKAERLVDGYRYQLREQTRTFGTAEELYASLSRRIGSRGYLIQQGIHVLQHEQRPYDFRIMVQVNPDGAWECTGTAARVAHPNKIVTNGSQGGTIFDPAMLLEPVSGKTHTSRLLEDMNQLGRWTAAQLSRSYPTLKELGLDVAVDWDLRLWILEVNTRPDPCPFTKLADPAIIRKIVRYAKHYGQRYSLTCTKSKKAPGV
ncbi:YheC/YheD family protein [Paenibacillus koleovorans]|uniref:YheC/YheD family protein n=1 Tax=Paenibacillus koleovorans TaxID=121608 RepID=UPI000FDC713F|nr:YheC/YheD family protein [Paenibacillus koleovorans]